MSRVTLLALAVATLGGCPQVADSDYQDVDVDVAGHLRQVGLGPGDVFEVRVFGEETLTGPHTISPDGMIRFPLVGVLKVDGLTPDAVAETISQRLADGYLRDPHVSVYVKEYNSKKVYVLGQVKKPGRLAYTSGMNIVEAIALAGDFSGGANQNYVVVTRTIDGNEQRIPVPVEKIAEGRAANFTLQPGDIVFVPDKLL